DLEHLRGQDKGANGLAGASSWAATGTLGAGIVAQWLLLTGVPVEEEPVLPLILLMGLSLMALVPAVLGPERSNSQRAGLLGLLILALIQLYLGVFGGYYGTLSGAAGLLACLLLWLPRR
ncbi:MAG TPA: hypothetical protein VEY88_26190, partial [Archangium sp.]|nr:hypothetical protein [Archangium sp.]